MNKNNTRNWKAPDLSSMVALTRHRAETQGDSVGYRYLVEGRETMVLTWGQLDRKAKAIARALSQFAKPGDCALLQYISGADFIPAYYGCLYAGVIAVPAYPPRKRALDRLLTIIQDCDASVILTTDQIVQRLEKWQEGLGETDVRLPPCLASNQVEESLADEYVMPRLNQDSLAFLQYTSGSTGMPKGVMVTHGNLIANMSLIQQGFSMDADTQMGGWLPLFHDMGLIGIMLQSVYMGMSSTIMNPVDFLKKPSRWVRAMSDYRATVTGAPNFAYDLCATAISEEEKQGLDLSNWLIAFNGAEPLRAETLDRFVRAFADYGLHPNTPFPCYGLAEGTLFITGSGCRKGYVSERIVTAELAKGRAVPADADDAEATLLVSSGRSYGNQTLRIVDPESLRVLPDRHVGEIWIKGPHIAVGYWKKPEQSKATFEAYTSDSGEGPFLRTGDLGYFADGELFVNGRIKDIIVIRGRNLYPQDIEAACWELDPALRDHAAAAFPVEHEGSEHVVVVQELDRSALRKVDYEALLERIYQMVIREFEVAPLDVVLIQPLTINKTSSGKIQRRACKKQYLEQTLKVLAHRPRVMAEAEPAPVAPMQDPAQTEDAASSSSTSADANSASATAARELRLWLRQAIAELLKLKPETIGEKVPFNSMGLDSLQAVTLAGRAEQHLGHEVNPTCIYDYPTITALADFLTGAAASSQAPAMEIVASPGEKAASEEPIAVVGMACRFPGAPHLDAFWDLLSQGRDGVREVPPDRWNLDDWYDNAGQVGRMGTKWGGFIDHPYHFDPLFFGITPREAELMDPQQRLLMETAYHALEHAGMAPSRWRSSLGGVFVGISNFDYARLQAHHPEGLRAHAGTGVAFSVAANRLSYFLDWRGPSMAVDTACSSSLVALHQACSAIRAGECGHALVGGVNLLLAPQPTVIFSQAGMMAPDGRCKTFDQRADGYVRSEGCGAVVLKPLSAALADGDRVLALVKGSAVNQDGKSNGLTAPNGPSQEAVIRQALQRSGLQPQDVTFVETHGTGTALGDPIEVGALAAALAPQGPRPQPLYLGAVKTQLGHLESAAGIAGFIKTVLALQHRVLPANLHFETCNPHIDLARGPFDLLQKSAPWPEHRPAVAGVSSFGFGGSNAHVVLEGYRPQKTKGRPGPSSTSKSTATLVLSAKSPSALAELALRQATDLQGNPQPDLNALCRSAATEREHLSCRAAVVGGDVTALRDGLTALGQNRQAQGVQTGNWNGDQPARVAFLFTGQGSQFPGMGRDLYQTEPLFAETLNTCEKILRPHLPKPLLEVMFAEPSQQAQDIHQTQYTQPALFALEVGLAKMWQSWGLQPVALLGHSIGELAGAHVAGIWNLEDALKLVAARSSLMQALPEGGAMAAVFTSRQEAEAAIAAHPHGLAIAAFNAPGHVTLSGEQPALEQVLANFEKASVGVRRLRVSHAFHSPLMEPMLRDFAAVAATLKYQKPAIPFVSSQTGKLESDLLCKPEYWVDGVRKSVDFAAGAQTLAHLTDLYLECGPANQLCHLVADAAYGPEATTIASLNRHTSDGEAVARAQAALFANGGHLAWEQVYRHSPRLSTSLPTYPFQRKAYKLAGLESGTQPSFGTQAGSPDHPLLGIRAETPALAAGTLLWNQTLRAGDHNSAFLNGHRMGGTPVFSQGAYLEMAMAAGRVAHPQKKIRVVQLELHHPLLLAPEQIIGLQTALDPSGQWRVLGRQNRDPWTLLATARIEAGV